MQEDAPRQIVVGKILGAFGVRGWVKVQSYTDPPENLLKYTPWSISGKSCEVLSGQPHGNVFVVRLKGIEQREDAAALQSQTITVPRDRFPPPAPGEYYWADLVGLEARTTAGMSLGKITGLMATGANDVLEVQGERERLIPFVMGEYVKEVRLEEGVLIVDWDPDF